MVFKGKIEYYGLVAYSKNRALTTVPKVHCESGRGSVTSSRSFNRLSIVGHMQNTSVDPSCLESMKHSMFREKLILNILLL